MSTVTVRVRLHTYRVLQEIARARDQSLIATLDRLVEAARRQHILEQASVAYEAVTANPDASAAWSAEIALWEVNCGDGLDQVAAAADTP